MPRGVVTVTSTVPVPAGLSAVIVVSLTTVKLVGGRRPEVDRRRAGETGAGDRDRRAAGGRTAGRAQARHRRRGGGRVRELIGGRGGRRADGVVTVTSTMPVPAGTVGRDRGVADHDETRGRPSCRNRPPSRR